MRILVDIDFPDDFLIPFLTIEERNRIILNRLQDAIDKEYPYALMRTVCVMSVTTKGK